MIFENHESLITIRESTSQQDQLDRAFTGLWGGSSGSSWTPETVLGPSGWAPAIDVFQRGNDLVIRADVPGLSKDDITVHCR